MKVLITGVGGFLGSTFAAWIREHFPAVEIHSIDDFSCGYEESVPAGVVMHELSLGRDLLRRSPVWGEYDYLFHFAAFACEGLSPWVRQHTYTNTILATAEIVNMAVECGCRRLVFTSSMAVYGRCPYDDRYGIADPPFYESLYCDPIDPYGIGKLSCEMDIQSAGEQFGLDWCVIRPHNLYGPGQSIWQKYRNVLGCWMASHFQNQPLMVYGDGKQRRAFSFIDDCLPCLWEAAIHPAASREIINLGGSEPIEIGEAARLLSCVMKGSRIIHAPARHEVHQAWCTTARSEAILGYKDVTPLETGLRRMYDWAKFAWARYPHRTLGAGVSPPEISRGLYPYWQELLDL